jgi:hypothetical protein
MDGPSRASISALCYAFVLSGGHFQFFLVVVNGVPFSKEGGPVLRRKLRQVLQHFGRGRGELPAQLDHPIDVLKEVDLYLPLTCSLCMEVRRLVVVGIEPELRPGTEKARTTAISSYLAIGHLSISGYKKCPVAFPAMGVSRKSSSNGWSQNNIWQQK